MKYLTHKKLNAGALQYTLFIAMLIVLLIASFLMVTFLQNTFKTNAGFQIRSIQNANLGFQYVSENDIPYNQKTTIKLPYDIGGQLTLLKKHWGIFDLVHIESKVKNKSFQKIGLIGGFQSKRPALYLKDNNNALVLVGDTKILGNAFLPKNGVKRGNIAGNSYYGTQLIYGTSKQSNKKLPRLKNREFIEFLSKEKHVIKNTGLLTLYEGLTVINSFSEPTKLYKQKGVINLREISLTGNIMIQSDTLIKVYNTALLSNIQLIAPYIELQSKVTGNFQVVASKNITVGADCQLTYPTALILNETVKLSNAESDKFSQLKIASGSTVKGIVAFLSNNKTVNYKAQIVLEKNAEIIGEVYCDQNFELKGEVKGTVYTNKFITNSYGSVYQNHIFNGSILQPELSEKYVGLAIEKSKSAVSTWLY